MLYRCTDCNREKPENEFYHCPACKEGKLLGEFPRNRSTRDGRAGYCKPCHAICLAAKPEYVGHDHRTGKVRGILCFNCNGALGQVRDRVDVLLAAIDYLGERPWRKHLVARGVYRLSF